MNWFKSTIEGVKQTLSIVSSIGAAAGVVVLIVVVLGLVENIRSLKRDNLALRQEQEGQFKKLAENMATGRVEVVEKHHWHETVKEMVSPEIRDRLDELDAKVVAIAEGKILTPEWAGTGVAEEPEVGVFTYEEPDRIRLTFTLETKEFEYWIGHSMIDLRITQGETRSGVQQWAVEAFDPDHPDDVYSVENFEVKLPPQKKKRWWLPFVAGTLAGLAVR